MYTDEAIRASRWHHDLHHPCFGLDVYCHLIKWINARQDMRVVNDEVIVVVDPNGDEEVSR